MFWLSFGKWASFHGRLFNRRRLYLDGYRWTPVVWITPRYLGS
jgi:hypothetical protein